MNKKNLILILLVFIGSFFIYKLNNKVTPINTEIRAVARVGKTIITNSELEKKIDVQLARLGKPIDDLSERENIREEALDALIQEKAIWSKSDNVEVKQYTLDSEAREEIEKLNLDESHIPIIKNEIKSNHSLENLMKPKVIQPEDETVTEREISKNLNEAAADSQEYSLQIISNNQKNKMQKAHKQIANGKSFEDVLDSFSDMEKTNIITGWVRLNRLPLEIRNAVQSMKKNSVSDVIETKGIYSLIKLGETREAQSITNTLVTYVAKTNKDSEPGIKGLNEISNKAKSCSNFYEMAKSLEEVEWEYRGIETKDKMYSIISNLNIDIATPILDEGNDKVIYMLCGYKYDPQFEKYKVLIKQALISYKKVKEQSNLIKKIMLDSDIEKYE